MRIKKMHYGWHVVIACFVVSAMGTGLLMNSMGTFIKPVSKSLGVERGQFSLSISLFTFMNMICYPLWGKNIEKYSIRDIMLFSSIFISLILFLYSISDSLWQFYILSMIMGCCYGAVSTLIVSTLINRWFVYRKGFALGIATSGSGLGSMILVPLISAVTSKFSWNVAYCMLSLIFFNTMILSIIIIRNSPRDKELEAYGFEMLSCGQNSNQVFDFDFESAITFRELWTTKCFKYYSITVLSIGILYGGVVNHLYAYFTDIGYDSTVATTFISLQMSFLLLGKFVLGIIFDKFGAIKGSLVSMFSYFVALICLIFAEIKKIAFIYTIFGGIGVSITAVGISYLTGYFFGNKDYSRNLSIIIAENSLGITIGTLMSGLIYDYLKNYRVVWVLYLILCILSICFFIKAVNEKIL